MASTQKDILDAVRTAINNLALTGVDEVRVRTSPSDGAHIFPGITVSATTEREYPGTNERDDIGYGITVTMVATDDADVDEDDLVGDWRQKIRKKLIHQKLSGVTGCCTVLWDSAQYEKDNKRNLGISTMLFRVIVRETRG
jgi:hypothetical protein